MDQSSSFDNYWPPANLIQASLLAQMLDNLPTTQETPVQIPGIPRKIPWRREWQPTRIFLPEESHGQRSLAGYSP